MKGGCVVGCIYRPTARLALDPPWEKHPSLVLCKIGKKIGLHDACAPGGAMQKHSAAGVGMSCAATTCGLEQSLTGVCARMCCPHEGNRSVV